MGRAVGEVPNHEELRSKVEAGEGLHRREVLLEEEDVGVVDREDGERRTEEEDGARLMLFGVGGKPVLTVRHGRGTTLSDNGGSSLPLVMLTSVELVEDRQSQTHTHTPLVQAKNMESVALTFYHILYLFLEAK